MYSIIAWISYLVRTFCLPNPFEFLGDSFVVDILGVTITMNPFMLNFLVVSPLLHIITYAVVGLYYSRGSDPAKGSFLYLLFYCIHAGLLYLMGLFGFASWAIALILVVYIAAHIGYNSLKNRLSCGV